MMSAGHPSSTGSWHHPSGTVTRIDVPTITELDLPFPSSACSDVIPGAQETPAYFLSSRIITCTLLALPGLRTAGGNVLFWPLWAGHASLSTMPFPSRTTCPGTSLPITLSSLFLILLVPKFLTPFFFFFHFTTSPVTQTQCSAL